MITNAHSVCETDVSYKFYKIFNKCNNDKSSNV